MIYESDLHDNLMLPNGYSLSVHEITMDRHSDGSSPASTSSTTNTHSDAPNTLQPQRSLRVSSAEVAKRSRASRAGTRCVTKLSPEALERKRANDREAQRAIRHRTKEHIEGLEKRIEQLSATNVDAVVLLEMKEKNEALEKEVVRLESLTIRNHSQTEAPRSWEAQNTSRINARNINFDKQVGAPTQQFNMLSEPGDISLHVNFPGYETRNPRMEYEPDAEVLRNAPHLEKRWANPAALNIPSTMMSYTCPQNTAPYNNPQQNISGSIIPNAQSGMYSYELPIRYAQPISATDQTLIRMVETQRELARAANSNSAPYHLPTQASLYGLLQPPPPLQTSYDPISDTLTYLIVSSPVKQLPERAACLWFMFLLTRWQICPNLETYDSIPAWYTPRPSQLFETHSIWISHIAFPKLRDRIIRNPHLYSTDELIHLYHSCLSVNWPYRDLDVLMFVDGEVRVTPLFKKHIQKLENWTLGEAFIRRYPELEDCVALGGFSQEISAGFMPS